MRKRVLGRQRALVVAADLVLLGRLRWRRVGPRRDGVGHDLRRRDARQAQVLEELQAVQQCRGRRV